VYKMFRDGNIFLFYIYNMYIYTIIYDQSTLFVFRFPYYILYTIKEGNNFFFFFNIRYIYKDLKCDIKQNKKEIG
jgi:hypothetical protein